MKLHSPTLLRAATLCLVAAGLALSGCSRKQEELSIEELISRNPSGAGVPQFDTAALSRPLSEGERDFVFDAAMNFSFKLEAAKLAASRSPSDAVRTYAMAVQNAYLAVDGQWQELLGRRGLKLPLALPAAQQAELDRLAAVSGAEFDRLFVQLIGIEQQSSDIALFENAARTTEDPSLRRFVETALPALRDDLAQAQHLVPGRGAAVASAG